MKRFPFLRTPQMWRLLLIFGAGVFMLVFTDSWLTPRSSPPAGETAARARAQPVAPDNLTAAENELEERLARILSEMDGAGSVQVTVRLKTGTEHIYAQNVSRLDRTIQEKDQDGGNRTTTELNEQNNLVLLQAVSGNQQEPVVLKEKHPEIAGVLVLADGARNPDLREKIIQAVETVLDVPSHRVMVLPKERR